MRNKILRNAIKFQCKISGININNIIVILQMTLRSFSAAKKSNV